MPKRSASPHPAGKGRGFARRKTEPSTRPTDGPHNVQRSNKTTLKAASIGSDTDSDEYDFYDDYGSDFDDEELRFEAHLAETTEDDDTEPEDESEAEESEEEDSSTEENETEEEEPKERDFAQERKLRAERLSQKNKEPVTAETAEDMVLHAKPCRDYLRPGDIYNNAHCSLPLLAAYLGFKNVAHLTHFMMSPAFLPAYIVYKEVGRAPFRSVWGTIPMLSDVERRKELVKDLQHAVQVRQNEYKGQPKAVADAVWWLVHNSAEVKDWSEEQQNAALDKSHKALGKWYPGSERLPKKHVRKDSALPAWQDPDDPEPDKEQCHRALQLLRGCERLEQLNKQDKDNGTNWMDFWLSPAAFQTESVPERLIPMWMSTRDMSKETDEFMAYFDKLRPPKSPCKITFLSNKQKSRARAAYPEWFDVCWAGEEERGQLPTNQDAYNSDPRDWSEGARWRDAIRWAVGCCRRFPHDNEEDVVVMKLVGVTLKAAGEDLVCYDVSQKHFEIDHHEAASFVDRHTECQISYFIDFLGPDERPQSAAHDFETDSAIGGMEPWFRYAEDGRLEEKPR